MAAIGPLAVSVEPVGIFSPSAGRLSGSSVLGPGAAPAEPAQTGAQDSRPSVPTVIISTIRAPCYDLTKLSAGVAAPSPPGREPTTPLPACGRFGPCPAPPARDATRASSSTGRAADF